MKVLGVIFDTVSFEDNNWQQKKNNNNKNNNNNQQVEKSINLWRSRFNLLSLPGKALIISTLGLSKLVYQAKVLILSEWVLTWVHALIWPFICGCKIETVSRNTCYLKILDGLLFCSTLI